MKVSQNKIDDLNLELTIEVEAADYAEIERKKLAERKRTADFKGFRKGMAPASLIKKFFGEQCLVEAVNQVLSQALDTHIKDNSLRIIGEPLSSENQPEVEWKDGNNFTFVFDLGLYPEINFDVVKDDKVPSYTVTISAKDKATMVENLKKYYEEKNKSAEEQSAAKEEKSDEDTEKEAAERLEADIEKEFDAVLADFRWQLVRGYLMKKYDLKIDEKDLHEAAEAFVTYQYAMYGLGNLPKEMIQEAVVNVLKNQEQVQRIAENVEDSKVMSKLKEEITLEPTKITSLKFKDLK